MYRIFESFRLKMKARFRSISRATRNQVSPEELESDSWLAADEIGKRRGKAIDFSDPADAELIMGAVHVRNVKRPEKNLQYASSIDEAYEGETNVWLHHLQADEATDPLVALLLRESTPNAESMLAASYSQAVAYVMTFVHFKNSRQDVCDYLVISDGTLTRRITSAATSVKIQPSLFDRIESIAETFRPKRGRQYAIKIQQQYSGTQLGWEF